MTRPTNCLSLKKRSEFLAVAAQGRKWVTPAFILQVGTRPRDDSSVSCCGFGLTASKKMIGNAVQRNRARRRLRALAIEVLGASAQPELNFVFIARDAILTRDSKKLRGDLETALRRLKVLRASTEVEA